MRLQLSFVVAGVLVAFASPSAAQSDADRAHDELEKGYALRKEGKCGEALPLLSDSYALVPQLKTLINLADCEETLAKLSSAHAHWAKALDEATANGDATIAALSKQHLEAVEKRAPRVTVKMAASAIAGAVVTLDGKALSATELGAPLWIDAGDHTVVVDAPGTAPNSYAIHVDEGKRLDLEVTTGAPSATTTTTTSATTTSDVAPGAQGPWRTIGWTALGVGAASVAVGAFFGVEAMSKKSDANCPGNSCANGGDPDALRTAVKDGNLSTIFFVAGGVLAASGITLLLVAPKDEAAPRATVSLAPNGVVLGGAW